MNENAVQIPNAPQCKRLLYKGMKGEDVKWMQELLSDLNAFYKFCPTPTPLKMTGVFGEDTAKFLKFYQYYENLIPDSRFDRATCDKLNYRYIDYLDIQNRSKFRYDNINDYLDSRFSD
jgi:peptidoglycan hydrolase-like protein with peptidoglycan-binding domain